MVRKPALRKEDPHASKGNLLVVFSLGLFVAAYLLTSGGAAGGGGGGAEPASHVGQNVTVTEDCDWARSLVLSVPVLQWDDSMAPLCGSVGVVLAYNKAVGLVKIQHQNGKVYAWPSGATSLDPKGVSLEFLHNRVRRAYAVAAELEKHLQASDPSFTVDAADFSSIERTLAAQTPDRPPSTPAAAKPTPPPPAAAPPPKKGPPQKAGKVAKIRFVHVPKAGGTAFTTALRTAVGCSAEPCMGNPKNQQPCDGVAGCYGHEAFNKGDVARRQSGEIDLLVLNVRKPVDRVISAFHHGQKEWPCCGLLMKQAFRDRLFMASANPDAFTLMTFAQEPSTRNCLAKMLSGKPCKAETDVTKDVYDRAVAAMADFDVILVMEEFEASLALLQCVTGVDMSDPVLTKTVRKGSYKVAEDEEERQAVATANRWDMLLYTKAVERFCQIYTQQQCGFELPSGLCAA
ncbi:hypothetical protein DIPPA_21330 [Diplonema papillatum]|nr:hypothetical protein DIPPA_21330 [Diplonema papillatum]